MLGRAWSPTTQEATLDLYEEVFQHHGYTGRSGSMYGFEGIGSIYWHMVAKLLVAVQESVGEAFDADAPPEVIDRLVGDYWRVRAGLGFNKTATEYGAFPTDPVLPHARPRRCPAAGDDRPGEGRTADPAAGAWGPGHRRADLLRSDPVAEGRVPRAAGDVADRWDSTTRTSTIDLPAGALGLTVCQVPVVVTLTSGEAGVEVSYTDGAEDRIEGLCVDAETSRAVFDRTGHIARLTAFIPEPAVTPVDQSVLAWPGRQKPRLSHARTDGVYPGSLPGFHLMEQPIDGYWTSATGWSARTASTAARRSAPVTGTPELGRDSSKRPR